ncbi:YdeI/OmpD-associated family protein [Tenacibaculum jejuense]|uniref:YdeI/OmpD-associated family protein n=1 Tax=Tenacibaculum jejuense TaxID=584609 RepID=UPI001E384964|nr:YdeI/OmpD-associated family protein [Tenacibaculum jejuense]
MGEIPEALQVLLAQDHDLNERFTRLTDGKKRSIIIQIGKIKNIDKQISKSIQLINNPNLGRKYKH